MSTNTQSSLSDADKDALERLPSGEWFSLKSVPFMVKNARWRCDRLAEKGALESRIEGDWPHIHTEWRKIECEATSP